MGQYFEKWYYNNAILLAFLLCIGGMGKTAVFFSTQVMDPGRIFSPDSRSYIDTANGFLQIGRFVVSPEMPDVYQIERTPGYPFFIASVFFFFGEKFSALIMIQILISLGTILLTYRITSAIWGKTAAQVSALLLSCDHLSFISSQEVLTETLFTFVLTASILAGISALKKSQHAVCLLLAHGTILALATLIRPILYYVIAPVLITFMLVWSVHFKWTWKKVVIHAIVFVLPWSLLIGGWQIRNYFVAGIAEFSSIQGVNLLFYRGAGIVAQLHGCSFEKARQHLGYERYMQLKSYSGTTAQTLAWWSQGWKRKGLSLICQHPWLSLKDQVRGAFRMMFETDWNALLIYIAGPYQENTGPGGDLFRLPINRYVRKWLLGNPLYFSLFLMAAGYLTLVYTGAIVSIYHLIRTKDPGWAFHVFSWIIILYFIIISAGPETYSRFRVPIMPLLSVYAGHGVHRVAFWFKQQIAHDKKPHAE